MEDATIDKREGNSTVVERFTLPNGVRVINEEIPWVESVSLGFFFLVGSTSEPKRLSGISHFLEHMVFKGSEKRSAKDIVMEIESLGGIINAATGKEFTHFYVRIYHKHIGEALDILTDLVFCPIIDDTDIKREKGVVLEEIMMGEDNPDEFIIERFHLNVYGDTPLGRKIIGSEATVNGFTRENLFAFHDRHYHPANLVISAAGHLTAKQLRALLEGSFRNAHKWRTVKKPRIAKPRFGADFHPTRFQLTKDVEQTTLMVGFPSVAITDPDRYTFALIDAHLSGGMSSRLFQEIREKRGLAYSVDSNQAPLSKCGLYTIEAGMAAENARRVAKILAKELKRIAMSGVPPKALKNACEYMKGVNLLALENSISRMGRNAMNEIYFNRVVPLSELLQALDNVKSNHTKTLAKRIFNPKQLACGILTSNDAKGNKDGLLNVVCEELARI